MILNVHLKHTHINFTTKMLFNLVCLFKPGNLYNSVVVSLLFVTYVMWPGSNVLLHIHRFLGLLQLTLLCEHSPLLKVMVRTVEVFYWLCTVDSFLFRPSLVNKNVQSNFQGNFGSILYASVDLALDVTNIIELYLYLYAKVYHKHKLTFHQ